MKPTNDIKFVIPVCLVLFMVGVSILGMYFGIAVQRQSYPGCDFSALNSCANKTVLFIGDGMGEAHITTTAAYYDKQMHMRSFAISGQVTTYSNSIFTPTDSAAAASAMATGQKYDNKEVSRHDGVDIQTITEYAKSLGYGVGIVTTDSLTGATPAAFSSHANKRGDSADIVAGQIESGIDLLLGAGKDFYLGYQTQFEAKNYKFCTSYADLSGDNGKIIASFASIVATNGTDSEPTLEMLTTFAINYFENNFPAGYFLMIEGAHIDKNSHNKNIQGMMSYLNSFDESIRIVDEKIASQNGTALIVTADHETGGLAYNGEEKDSINNSLYKQNGHTAANVPYFVKLSPKEAIGTIQSDVFPNVIDNTDIFRLCKAIIT